MRGLHIVCSPNRSTQEWPPTWCTNGSSITPFPGYGVPSACMRASRAGLILTPHRTNDRGGPRSVGRQEARPLVWLPILTGALLGRLLEHSCEKQRAGQEGHRKRQNIPYFLSFPLRRTNDKSSSRVLVNLRVIKRYFKAA